MANNNVTETTVGQILTWMTSCPELLESIRAMKEEMSGLRSDLKNARPVTAESDGWLDAKAAGKYLKMSPATFNKYRYETTPKIKGYKVGGKMLYEKTDLDNFVKLWEIKSAGLA